MTMHRPRLSSVAAAALLAALSASCGSRAVTVPTMPSPVQNPVPIMGTSQLDAAQLLAWFNGRQPRPSGEYTATEPIEMLVEYYIDEGAAEGVTGDVAFVQSIVETGWFRFSGTVPAWKNNFAGIGATDSSPEPAAFPDARTGVRAQIQHLRAYADASATDCSMPPLHNPCVDPRFNLVLPKGRAPTWNLMGSGNWATAPTYAASILGLYNEARAYHGLH